MGTIATVRVNTSQRMVLYRDFTIQEFADGWIWSDWEVQETEASPHGFCQTMFECIDAVDNWHDNRAEADYLARQQSLMESGGPDDRAYRRDMFNAGRGHLVRP